jgi:hypothetical protein
VTDEGQAIVRMAFNQLFVHGDLHTFDNPLFKTLTNMVEVELDCEVQEYLEYELDDEELVFHFAIFRNDQNHNWNERKMPYAWISIDTDLDFNIDMDFN